jgi:catechol 2,3-dioxygenase-like lactoylglutathione lyase family enzyme
MTSLFRLVVAGLLVAAAPVAASAQVVPGSPVSLSTQPSMNVFRRFAVDRAKMIEFYGAVLGLKPMPPLALGGGSEMIRFQVGTTEVKLQATPAAAAYPRGPVREVVGLRVFTVLVPDQASVAARFKAHGYPAPEFRRLRDGRSSAMVLDPERQWVELVVVPGAPPETFDRFEAGLTVSNLERSRAFYRSFVGLAELPPVDDEVLGTRKYAFRHGTMTVNLWSASGPGLPAAAPSAGIQYVIRDIDTVDALARAQHIKIDRPLGNFNAGLRTLWLMDPDDITNYFAQVTRR